MTVTNGGACGSAARRVPGGGGGGGVTPPPIHFVPKSDTSGGVPGGGTGGVSEDRLRIIFNLPPLEDEDGGS